MTRLDHEGFIESVSRVAAGDIRTSILQLPKSEQVAIQRVALEVLRCNSHLRTNEKMRSGAVRIVVALLPETFDDVEAILCDTSLPGWYEVHFTLFAALDREQLKTIDQARVLDLIRTYLMTTRSNAGFAAWKAGLILGEDWRDPRSSLKVLGEILGSARYVAGRKAGLHGIEHALRLATQQEEKYLLKVVREASKSDRSEELRRRARAILKGERCGSSVLTRHE